MAALCFIFPPVTAGVMPHHMAEGTLDIDQEVDRAAIRAHLRTY